MERHHVDFYKETLKQHGEDVPFISGELTSLAGHILGRPLLDLTTADNRYKLGMAVENKAIEMYRAFILKAYEHPDIYKRLYHNMVDKESGRACFINDFIKAMKKTGIFLKSPGFFLLI